MIGKTYRGWSKERIETAEDEGDYIPQTVMMAYVNDDWDGCDDHPCTFCRGEGCINGEKCPICGGSGIYPDQTPF